MPPLRWPQETLEAKGSTADAESIPVFTESKFVVKIKKPSGCSLGLDVDALDRHVLMVLSVVEKSIFAAYNETAPKDMVVVMGDRIIGVNGITGFAPSLLTEIEASEDLEITLEHCKEIRVRLQKEVDLGISINYSAKSPYLCVKSVETDGAFATWNAAHPATPVRPHDKIVAIDGVYCNADILLNRMKQQADMTLTIYSWDYDSKRSF